MTNGIKEKKDRSEAHQWKHTKENKQFKRVGKTAHSTQQANFFFHMMKPMNEQLKLVATRPGVCVECIDIYGIALNVRDRDGNQRKRA